MTTESNQEYQIRDKRGGQRYFIDNYFLRGGYGNELGPYAIAVYNALALHANSEQEAWPSNSKIASLTGMSARQVSREIEKLVNYKIISIRSRAEERKPSIVTLLDKSEWEPIPVSTPNGHTTDRHMTLSHMSDSQQTYDSESYEHMTGSHTNNTNKQNKENKTHIGDSHNQKPIDYIETVVNNLGQVSEESASPTDQWLTYRDEAIRIFDDKSGAWGRTPQERQTRRERVGELAGRPDFDPARWERSITESILNGVGPANINRFIEVYELGGSYQAYLNKQYPGRNGNGNATNGTVIQTSDGGYYV